ncbi:hypothetical protein LXA43DRAFT_879541 [Ganoderma leucocontextum]|nr:hypothetical protein LXA43DRAFT_879541 [Ganoderma leucocontextum]
MVSMHNPFRSPTVTPTTTGRIGNSSPPLPPIPPDDDAPIRPSYAPPPGPPPQRIQQSSGTPEETRGSVADILTEELPPAYTAAPNLREGESTLEVGPRRPFQQPAAVPRRQELHFPPQSWPPPESWGGTSPHATGDSWTSFPGNLHRSQTGVDRARLAPPPQHPTQRSYETRARPTSHPNIPINVSDFARDFYAAGPEDSGLYGGLSTQYRSSSAGTSPTSSSGVPPSSTGFAPPSEDPPPRGKRNAPSNGVPDDGRPTDRPVPGHPLLRHGKVLVYPNGYECQKCQNTGYKNYDPSHPCSRCWEKYAKPFSGPITYAPWTSDGQSASSSSSTFQRPLPTFRAPQASLHNNSASWAGRTSGGSDLSRSATTSRATYGAGGYPGASARVVPIAGGILPMSSYLDRLGTGVGGLAPRTGFPPSSWAPAGQLSGTPESSGAVVVYPPGDSRIGGRLCWRCGGSGRTSFLIFDETTCTVCDGVGRTFV